MLTIAFTMTGQADSTAWSPTKAAKIQIIVRSATDLLGHYGGDKSQVDSSCGVAVNHFSGMKFGMLTVDVDNSSRQMYR